MNIKTFKPSKWWCRYGKRLQTFQPESFWNQVHNISEVDELVKSSCKFIHMYHLDLPTSGIHVHYVCFLHHIFMYFYACLTNLWNLRRFKEPQPMATLAWAFSTLSFRPENLLKNILSQSARTARNRTETEGKDGEMGSPKKNWGGFLV